jgi:hypothetical protein
MIPKEKLTQLNNLLRSGESDTLKLIAAAAEALNEMHGILESYDETFDEMAEILGDVEESVLELEDEVFGDEKPGIDDYGDFDGDDIYDVNCANCDKTITVDYDALDMGSVTCPGCGEVIEFTLELEDED